MLQVQPIRRATIMNAPTSVLFDRAAVEGEIVQLQALVDSIKEKRGNAAKRIADATLSALGQSVSFDIDSVPAAFVPDLDGENATANLSDVAQYVEDLTSWADQLRNEAVTSILKANGQTDNVAALREQYTTKRTLVEAMKTLCEAQGIDVSDIVIPHVGGGRPPGSTSTRKPGSKFARFYRVVSGERREQSDSQNTLSSFVYYHGQRMLGLESRPSTAEVTAWLKTQGVDSPMGKSWSLDVDGVTYGMDVETETAAAGSEEE